MNRLDYPKLETCSGRESNPVGGEHSRKEPLEQLVNSYSEYLHISPQPVGNASDILIFEHN